MSAQTAAEQSDTTDTTEDLAHRLGISLDRLRGFLIGSLLGDALGGPIEFSDPDRLPDDMPHVRHWKAGTKLTATHCETLARTLRLRGYETLRPETAPFGPWRKRAPAGTITDDPRQLFEKLEQEGKPHYWWDAHFTFVVPLAIMHLCRDDPMAAMNLCLDFGHDTDSYAQLLGAWIGAIHGREVFPESMVRQVETRLQVDFGESVDEWCRTLLKAADRAEHQQLRFAR
nr:ADP-ribosylglycohydrolase family protein [Rhodopirellula sp. SM50]